MPPGVCAGGRAAGDTALLLAARRTHVQRTTSNTPVLDVTAAAGLRPKPVSLSTFICAHTHTHTHIYTQTHLVHLVHRIGR